MSDIYKIDSLKISLFSNGITNAIKKEDAKNRKRWIEVICGIKYKKLLSHQRLEFKITFIHRGMSSIHKDAFLKFEIAAIEVLKFEAIQSVRKSNFTENVLGKIYMKGHILAWKNIDFELGA